MDETEKDSQMIKSCFDNIFISCSYFVDVMNNIVLWFIKKKTQIAS